MIKVAGIVRKSPTNKGVEENIEIQKSAISNWCINKFGLNDYILELFIDKDVKGDSPNRPELIKLFNRVDEFDYAVAHVVDRYTRSWLGLKWFFENFTTEDGLKPHNGCRLYFVEGMSSLYKENKTVDGNSIFVLGALCMKAYSELLDIRRRTQAGRDKLTPEERAKKYKGGKKGRTWKKKK